MRLRLCCRLPHALMLLLFAELPRLRRCRVCCFRAATRVYNRSITPPGVADGHYFPDVYHCCAPPILRYVLPSRFFARLLSRCRVDFLRRLLLRFAAPMPCRLARHIDYIDDGAARLRLMLRFAMSCLRRC